MSIRERGLPSEPGPIKRTIDLGHDSIGDPSSILGSPPQDNIWQNRGGGGRRDRRTVKFSIPPSELAEAIKSDIDASHERGVPIFESAVIRRLLPIVDVARGKKNRAAAERYVVRVIRTARRKGSKQIRGPF